MNKLITLGVAAALALSTSGAVFAEDVKAGAKAGAGAAVGMDAGGAALDATTTASVGANANYGSLISGIQSGAKVDLSTYAQGSTQLTCVKVSSLQGEANANAQALANARTKNQQAIADLQSDVEASGVLWSDIQAECGIADLSIEDVLSVQTDASGAFIVYVDDAA